MATMFPALLLVFVQLIAMAHSSVEHRICLSCPRVGHPSQCQTYAEIWSHERCSIKLFLLLNGTTVYKFGYESATNCVHSDVMAHPTNQQFRRAITDIVLCHECCTGSLCNRKLCGVPGSNDTRLACLDDLLSRSITYCNYGEKCFAGVHNPRPHYINGNYGCVTQVVCDHLLSGSPEDDSHELCRKCCSQDGCNAYLCHMPGLDTPGSTTFGPVPDTRGSTTFAIDTTTEADTYADCWDLRTRGGFHQTAVYDIYPAPSNSHLRVRCDMVTDGGGWTVLQRRYDGSLSFNRTLREYQNGFGDVRGEHWIGLDWMHALTSQGAVQLRVDLCTFTRQAGYIVYNGFNISDQSDTYQLNTGTRLKGDISNQLQYHNAGVFQTPGCARIYPGGWWSGSVCYSVNLNGVRYNGGPAHGIVWYRFGTSSTHESLKSSELKIRPVHATEDSSQPYTCPR